MKKVIRRDDVTSSSVLALYQNNYTLNDMAVELNCSIDTIKKRLCSLGLDIDKSAGASRHYQQKHDAIWLDIKADFDDNKSMNYVSKKYNISYDSLHKLIEQNDYDYKHVASDAILISNEYKQQLFDLLKHHSVKEIAVILNKSERTVSRHLSNFGLSLSSVRADISDDDILAMWNAGNSINQIAQKYDCSHDTVTKRLAKYNISSDRQTGIERHFDNMHDTDWDVIKLDLDKCMPVSVVATRHNIRYEAVYRMMERHGYEYHGLQKLDESILQHRIDVCVDSNEYEYLSSIMNYYKLYKNLPVVYTLSRYMNRKMSVVRCDITKYQLYDFIGNNGPSVNVLRLLHDLDDLCIKYELNNRKILKTENNTFMEIDIYIPDFKLGIEVNPTWTHSIDTLPYGQSDKCYHQNKSLLARKCGIGLLQMYDVDFIDDRRYEVVMNQIKARLNTKKKIGARCCDIRLIERHNSNEFLNEFHFQGAENSSFMQYGMFYKDFLLGVFTIGSSRYTDDLYEIIRYCMHPDYIVIGGFDKFLKNFTKSLYVSCDIVSYMDLNKRLVSSNVYENHQFDYVGVTTPDYVWINQSGTDYKSRYAVTKQQLVKKGYDVNKTEVEIMRDLNYCRVYGSGSLKYVYHHRIV